MIGSGWLKVCGVGGCVPAEESQSAFYREIGDVVPLEQFVEFTGGP